MIEAISLYNCDGFCGSADNISCADDWAEASSYHVYTIKRKGKTELWGSSFDNVGIIDKYWVHTEENGDIPRKWLKPGQKFEPVKLR